MICNRCGTEYTGDQCPICFHQLTPTPELTASPDLEATEPSFHAAQNPIPTQPPVSSGVHSDTVRDPFQSPQGSYPPPPPTGQWNQNLPNQGNAVGWNAASTDPLSQAQPQPAPQQRAFRFCPQCGAELHGKFCSQCGHRIEDTPQSPTSNQIYVNGRPVVHNPNNPSPYAPYVTNQPAQTAYYPPNPNAVHSFTERYLQEIRSGDPKYQKKLSPWVKALIVVMILFQLMGVITSIAYYFNSENLIDDFLNDYGYGDVYDNWDTPPDEYLDVEPDLYHDSDLQDHNIIPEGITDTGESILPNGVSIEEYRQIAIGMDYATVSAIIGGDAMSTETLEEDNKIIALWPGEYRINAVVTVTFEDGAVSSVEQRGLYESE